MECRWTKVKGFKFVCRDPFLLGSRLFCGICAIRAPQPPQQLGVIEMQLQRVKDWRLFKKTVEKWQKKTHLQAFQQKLLLLVCRSHLDMPAP
jgi:hypothetical protein